MNGLLDDSISFYAGSGLTFHFNPKLDIQSIVSDPVPQASLETFSVDEMLISSDDRAVLKWVGVELQAADPAAETDIYNLNSEDCHSYIINPDSR